VNPGAVWPGGAADRLAVRGGLGQQPGNGGLAVPRGGAALFPLAAGRLRQLILASLGHGGEVAVHRVVHGRVVRLGEDTAEGALARRPDQPGQRVAPPAQGG
jgi:hypothetical protein